jgi:hypothetical protein
VLGSASGGRIEEPELLDHADELTSGRISDPIWP